MLVNLLIKIIVVIFNYVGKLFTVILEKIFNESMIDGKEFQLSY